MRNRDNLTAGRRSPRRVLTAGLGAIGALGLAVAMVAGGAGAGAASGAGLARGHVVRAVRGQTRLHRIGTVSLLALARADDRRADVHQAAAGDAARRRAARLTVTPLRLPAGAAAGPGPGVTGGTVDARLTGNVRGAHGFDGLSSAISGALNSRPAHGIGYVSPPDQALAAGPSPRGTVVLQYVNDAVSIYSPAGRTLLGPVPGYQFYGLPAGTVLSDPRAYRDNFSNHWFLTGSVAGDGVRSPLSTEFIAVSQTTSPFGDWATFSVDTASSGDTAGGCPCFASFAQLGSTAGRLFISASQFSVDHGNFNGSVIYELSIANLLQAALQPGLPVPVSTYQLPPAADPFGAYDLSPSMDAPGSPDGTPYFVESDTSHNHGSGLEVYALVNGYPGTLVETSVAAEPYSLPPSASQRRGPVPYGCSVGFCKTARLDTGSDAVQEVTIGQNVYVELDTAVKVGRTQRTGVAWFVLQVTGHPDSVSATLVSQGYVKTPLDLLDPVIGVSEAGVGYLAFTAAGPDRYPSAAYVTFNGPSGPAGPVHIAATGAGPLDDFTCYPRFSAGQCRFGDYSMAVYWGRRVYMAVEYVVPQKDRDTYSNWGSRVWYAPTR